jgi:predicted lysophospholipase L1 biosynthesis ABC-type transport system permease subunit
VYAADHTYRERTIAPLRRFKTIAPGYFATVGQRMVAGRDLTWADIYNNGGVVAIVSENTAREMWGSPDTLETFYDRSLARTSFTLLLLATASSMALVLGVVGIYGVVSYSVTQRTREIGIRLALGAPIAQVTAAFVRSGVILSAVGCACGLAVALVLAPLMKSLLFSVSPSDPPTYAAMSVSLILAAALASYLPARKAVKVDPVEALRAE